MGVCAEGEMNIFWLWVTGQTAMNTGFDSVRALFSFSPPSCVNWGLLTCPPHLSWLLCAAGGGNSGVAKRHSSAAPVRCTGTGVPALLFHKACSWTPEVSLVSKLCRPSWAFPPDLHGRALSLVDLYSCLLTQPILCFYDLELIIYDTEKPES